MRFLYPALVCTEASGAFILGCCGRAAGIYASADPPAFPQAYLIYCNILPIRNSGTLLNTSAPRLPAIRRQAQRKEGCISKVETAI